MLNTPKLLILNIPKETIRCVIKTIQEIQKKTDTFIPIKEKEKIISGDFGIVEILGIQENKIKNITFQSELGGVYDAKVKFLKEFVAIVEILNGKEYLLHISEINWEQLKKVEDVLKIGKIIRVKLMGIDSMSFIY